MALYSKEAMEQRGKYTYTWTVSSGDNPKITDKRDSGRVSKKEGYEVRDLINAMAEKWDLKQLSSAHKLEDMIHSSGKVMRDEVISWVSSNWKTFQA